MFEKFFLAGTRMCNFSRGPDRGVGSEEVSREKSKDISAKLEQQMMQLAEAKVNDAVKLAFLSDGECGEIDKIDKLDLTTLAEFKRGSNGVVEIKFADRMKTIERLMELYREDPGERLLRQLAGEADG